MLHPKQRLRTAAIHCTIAYSMVARKRLDFRARRLDHGGLDAPSQAQELSAEGVVHQGDVSQAEADGHVGGYAAQHIQAHDSERQSGAAWSKAAEPQEVAEIPRDHEHEAQEGDLAEVVQNAISGHRHPQQREACDAIEGDADDHGRRIPHAHVDAQEVDRVVADADCDHAARDERLDRRAADRLQLLTNAAKHLLKAQQPSEDPDRAARRRHFQGQRSALWHFETASNVAHFQRTLMNVI
eukprot:scaffold48_cov311-Pinguiococcus_pyrenoidosus.AAC.131